MHNVVCLASASVSSRDGFHATIAQNFLGGESRHYIHSVKQVFSYTLNDFQKIPPSPIEDI